MALNSSKSYHIGRNGKPAVCKAAPGSCPLGGQHFANKAIADFYVETQVNLASEQDTETLIYQMANEHLDQRIEEVRFLKNLQPHTHEQRAQLRRMRKLFNGYTPEDMTWDLPTLEQEQERREAVTAEREWQAIVDGSKAVDAMTVDQINRRLQLLKPLRRAIDSGDHEAGRRTVSYLKAKYGFHEDDQSWNPMMLEGALENRVKDHERSLGIRNASTSRAHSPEQSRY